jgi:S1-C subfamily serine protease
LELGDESVLHQGDAVYAIGAPEGLMLSLTSGIVSSFRNINDQFFIQETAPIAHGSSGGPLFDDSGRVIGVTTLLLKDAPGVYFSVAVGDLKRLLKTTQSQIVPLADWSGRVPLEPSHLSQQSKGSNLSGKSVPIQGGYENGQLTSWRGEKNQERTFFVSSDSYVYGVTQLVRPNVVLGVLAPGLAAIGARNPLATLPLGSEVRFRIQGRAMYIFLDNKETMYSVDTANPR